MRNILAVLSTVIGSVVAGGMPKDMNDMEIELGGELQAEAGFNSQKTHAHNDATGVLHEEAL